MSKDQQNLSSLCWNKFKELHTEKIVYLQKIYTYFEEFFKILSEFENKYKLLEMESYINKIENNKINETIKLIHKSIVLFLDTYRTMTKNILACFKDTNKLIKHENENYKEILLNYNEYNESKEKMNSLENIFVEKMRNIEEVVKSNLINNNKNFQIDLKEMDPVIKEFNEYKKCVGETNERRERFNKNQEQLLKIYNKVILEQESTLCQKINVNFFMVQKSENDFSSSNIDKIKERKKINKNEYNKEIISHYQSNEKPEEEIEVTAYHLKHKPYISNNEGTPEDISNAYKINEDLLKSLRKIISENFKNSHLQIQESLIELPQILTDYFAITLELTDDNKNEIIKLITEDLTIYPQILTVLSRERANSKLYKSNEHIKFLGVIFQHILEIAEQKKDYNAAKNCLLLSQTYHIKDEETKKKQYLFDIIKTNKWINGEEFWKDFILNQIQKEFRKFEELYPNEKLNLMENNNQISTKFQERIREILFSCLLSNLSNMMELHIEKKITLKILDYFINKLHYLDEESKANLYNIISSDNEVILNLRKEYEENSNVSI